LNYRHAYHAGNFADVMKHALLARILVHLRRKETAFRVIDSHAGIGWYDVAGPEAERTAEWRDGVGRLDEPFDAAVEALLEPYRAVLAAARLRHGATAVPGSPLVIREMLRRQDRAILLELHPADGPLLSQHFNQVANVKVIQADGWAALAGLLPPRERRGLVLIDPPYEQPDEFERLAPRLGCVLAKWPTDIVALWYPIKDAAFIEDMAGRLASAMRRPALRLEMTLAPSKGAERLNGCGLFVVNPPWTLAGEAEIMLPALAARLGRGGRGGFRCQAIPPQEQLSGAAS
jgi:23S rRNA (adenine2030-N6)-methyltransferase